MSSARDVVLARIRDALADVPAAERPGDVHVARGYRHADDRDSAALQDLFAERLSDYGARVHRVPPSAVAGAIEDACRHSGVDRVVVPPGLPAAWRPAAIDVVEDDGRPGRELDGIDGVITGCAAAVAETGTLILDAGPTQGRRALTLVPDHHVCVVESGQLVGLVPEALARLAEEPGGTSRPITLVSGPSASSDIELQRVEGVHGPRHLVVILVTA